MTCNEQPGPSACHESKLNHKSDKHGLQVRVKLICPDQRKDYPWDCEALGVM
jgi:hypothetical protein